MSPSNRTKEWLALTRALDRPEWLDDPRFLNPALRQDNIDDRLALTQEVLETNTSAHWLERLEAEGVPCAPVLTRGQFISHPQILAEGIIAESEHPDAGPLRQARPAALFSGTPTEHRRGGPGLGEHTGEVLEEIGFSDDEIAVLRQDGVISADDGQAAA